MHEHPLDFDWRFSDETCRRLVAMLRGFERILCVGTPSLAPFFDKNGASFTLIDRHPNVWSKTIQHAVGQTIDLATSPDAAIFDPPWYPDDLEQWSCWIAGMLAPGTPMFASVWPAHARAEASDELDRVLCHIATWADVELSQGAVTYRRPHFEERAIGQCGLPAAGSPLVGEIVKITPWRTPGQMADPAVAANWKRYVFGDYQLAIRLSSEEAQPIAIDKVSGAIGWVWPYVSRRASGRESIDLWSSSNEVASIRGSTQLVGLLDQLCEGALKCKSWRLDILPEPLRHWDLPQHLPERIIQWQHRE